MEKSNQDFLNLNKIIIIKLLIKPNKTKYSYLYNKRVLA